MSRFILFHVSPASYDFQKPAYPGETFPLTVFSPAPTYIIFGSDSLTVTAPIEPPKYPSEIFFHVTPELIVFHTPPPVEPK